MRRVVVTGVGAVSPCGLDTRSTWDAICAGKSGIERISGFDPTEFTSQIAGECRGFDPEKYIEKKRVREMARFIHLSIAASEMAVGESGLLESGHDKDRIGTFVGVGLCGLEHIEESARRLFEKGPSRISPYFIPATISNLSPGQISMRWGFRGPSFTTTSACSSGGHAIGEAYKWIQRGGIDAAVVGGTEATVTPLGVGGFCALRALSKRNSEPSKASRPFDRGRDGFVIAEGSGMMVIEDLESAKKRGAPILAEITGYGATADAYHLTQPAPEGEGAQRAMHAALTDAKIAASDVDYINAHGTSTPTGDMQELGAIRGVFGAHATNGLWISSTKSMTGHLLGAAGGLEAVLTVLALKDGIVPPTINLDEPEPESAGLELVPHEARKRPLRIAMSNSFGFGGTNVTLVFSKHG